MWNITSSGDTKYNSQLMFNTDCQLDNGDVSCSRGDADCKRKYLLPEDPRKPDTQPTF